MKNISLGSTGITTPQNAFGALPIQRVNEETALRIIRSAYDGGMTFFDTARAYSDSEIKLGKAFEGMRSKTFIASKTMAKTPEDFWKDLETSLSNLKTDYIDIYQFHWPKTCYKPGDGTGMYECMIKAKTQGKIRHIGLTNHSYDIAIECIESGLYETLQYPFSYLSSKKEIELAQKCKEANMGFIAMKALAGGLITNSAAIFSYISTFENVLPIWGIQKETELNEFISYMKNPPSFTKEIQDFIEGERNELMGTFCRGCGYCMPCPVGIQINMCARMSLFIRRTPSEGQLTPKAQEMMKNTENCTNCGSCKSKCPYRLNIPELLKKNYEDYKNILSGKVKAE